MNDSRTPAGWTEATIGDLVESLQYGLTAKADHALQGPRFLRITDLDSGTIDWSTVPGCVLSKSDVDKYRLLTDDIVFARTGSIEKAARIVNPPDDAVFASYLIRGRPVVRDVARWLGLFVGSVSYVNQAKGLSAGIGRANVNAQNLARIRVALPPIFEQQRIVEVVDSYLSRLDDATASLERVQAKLKAYRASILKAGVEGRLVATEASLSRTENRSYEPAQALLARVLQERRDRWEEAELAKLARKRTVPRDDKWKFNYMEPMSPDVSLLPQLPKGWCWATIDQVCTKITDGEHLSPRTTQSGVFLLSAKDTREHGVVFDDPKFVSAADAQRFRKRCDPEKGDILMVSRGATVGRASVVQVDTMFCLMGSVILLKVHPLVSSDYLNFNLRSTAVKGQMTVLSGSTAQQAIYLRDLKTMPIALPPAPEQVRIAGQVSTALSLADQCASESTRAARRALRLRQAILKWAFGGKLVDQDPNDESAKALLARISSERAAVAATEKSHSRKPRGAD